MTRSSSRRARSYPPQFKLTPEVSRTGREDLKLACKMFDLVLDHNRDVQVSFPSGDTRRLFVSDNEPLMPLPQFMSAAFATCPKTWPCALWMCDTAARRCQLPITPRTVRRMLTGAVYLLLSTEDEGIEELSRVSSKRVEKVELLGWGMFQLLKDTPNYSYARFLDELKGTLTEEAGVAEDSWETRVGMIHLGWLRPGLDRFVQRLKECPQDAENVRYLFNNEVVTPDATSELSVTTDNLSRKSSARTARSRTGSVAITDEQTSLPEVDSITVARVPSIRNGLVASRRMAAAQQYGATMAGSAK